MSRRQRRYQECLQRISRLGLDLGLREPRPGDAPFGPGAIIPIQPGGSVIFLNGQEWSSHTKNVADEQPEHEEDRSDGEV